MSKQTLFIIIVAILLIAIGIGAYIYWINYKKSTVENPLSDSDTSAEDITDNVTKGVLPELQTNPLEDKPDVNPAGKANPFTNIKTNPF